MHYPRNAQTKTDEATPFSEDAEKGVISSLLQSPGEVFALCSQHLNASAFYIPSHAILFDTISEWSKPNERVDFVWLRETLTARDQLAEVGGKSALSELYDFVPTAANAEHYIRIVVEKYALRKTIEICQRVVNQCRDGDTDAGTILSRASQHLAKVVHGRNGAQHADDMEADEAPEEDLELDINEADEQELFKAASDEINNPRTLEQNRALLTALPEWLASLIREWMRFVQIPALLPTTCALVSISAVLMRGLRCRARKGWVYPHLYAVLGATSGIGKTLVYNEATRPLRELDKELQLGVKELKGKLRTELGIIESTIKIKMSAHEKALKEEKTLNEADLEKFKAVLSGLHQAKQEFEDQLKKHRSLWTSDITSEALGTRLQDNDEQMSIQSDEGGVTLFNIEGKYNDKGQTDDILLCSCFSGSSHKVDRISRDPVDLAEPRCSLLLLTQPDLLRRAFRNERLIIGGFLARAFSTDCKLKMQPELPEEQDEINKELTEKWNKEIKDLYHQFRCAKEPCTVEVAKEARVRARRHYNAIVQLVRGRLNDIDNFAARWTELTWRVALVLHAIRYGITCDEVVLSGETYDGAAAITKIFYLEQLKVLQALRITRVHDTHAALQTLFLERQNAPITFRELGRQGLEKSDLDICVKTYPGVYGVTKKKNRHGEPSTLLSLKAFPPSFRATP